MLKRKKHGLDGVGGGGRAIKFIHKSYSSELG